MNTACAMTNRTYSFRGRIAAAAAALTVAACGGGGGGSGPGAPGPDTPFHDRYATSASQFRGSQHTATLAADGTVLLIGGSRGESVLSDAIDRFDPATGAVTRVGNLSGGRSAHRATRLTSGNILVTGGYSSAGDARVAQRVDEATGHATASGTMSVPRSGHAAALLRDGRVLVTGGNAANEQMPLGISNTAEIWDPATQTFRKLASRMRLPRTSHTMTVLRDGRVLIVGGFTSTPAYELGEIFDPATETFIAVAGPAELRANHTAHLDSNGGVLVLGGETVSPDGLAVVPLKTVLRFDQVVGGFTSMASLSVARTFADSVMLPSGDVYLFGGQTTMPDYTATAERYTTATGGMPIASLPGARALHTVTRLATGRILVAGGEAPGGAYTTSLLQYE